MKHGTFSETTLAQLTAAGWKKNRKVDISKYLTAFQEEGVALPERVQKFLSRFGGLIIFYETEQEVKDTIDFNAEEAVQGLGHGALRCYEEITHSTLTPIGYCSFGTCLLLMAETGKVYGGADWTLFLFGNSGADAIENIVRGKLAERIHDYR